MSAFAALAGFDGGDEKDIAAAHKEQLQKEEANREAEARAAQAAFADFRAKAGQSSWGDDDDEDEFLSLPVLPQQHVPNKSRRKKGDGKQQAENEEVDSLLAELENIDVAAGNKEGGGLSKAALKRAKKKAQAQGATGEADEQASARAGGDAAADAAAAEGATEGDGLGASGEGGEGDASTAGKTPEEIKAMMKARAAAAAKKKPGKMSAAQSAAAAAAGSRSAANGKKKKDKSHYNQAPNM